MDSTCIAMFTVLLFNNTLQTVENGCLEGVFPKDQCPDVTMTIVPPVAGGNPDLDGQSPRHVVGGVGGSVGGDGVVVKICGCSCCCWWCGGVVVWWCGVSCCC